ncbi:MAG: beta-N-acetylhexosaminidase, partial [Candidatus Eremiobacteraeota bacterium]|nr:beta-N-acetylhexosaminidase [Candidatus Eremiobacteraeota bacterium]
MLTLAPIASLAAFFLCALPARAQNVVPQPQRVTTTAQRYALPATVTIDANATASQLVPLARSILREHATGASLTLSAAANDSALGTEGYRLHVDATGIAIAANAPAGVFYGLQTLDQLLPAPFSRAELPGIDIVDWPRYAWRGVHLDVSRHFFPVSVVERFIDVAAHYKLNVFHWHLTDDQGWRIAIARYPRLTTVGGCRDGTEQEGDATEIDGKRYCGFYTQAQIRSVVAYARDRFVTIVPEIEMPGHSQAAIAAYPRLSCDDGRYGVRETWGVSDVVYCPTAYTFDFLENVLREVIALFPGTFVHIGGDEVPKAAWQRSPAVRDLMRREHIATYEGVQGYFDRRIEHFLHVHGRRAIGWDDILQGGVSTRAAIMSWHGDSGAIAAAHRGNDAVVTPDGPLYFDAYQGDPNDEPQAIGSLSTPEMVYEYEPTPSALNAEQARHVIGVQGNVWSEFIGTRDYLDYMLLPRMVALSEIAWRDPHPR